MLNFDSCQNYKEPGLLSIQVYTNALQNIHDPAERQALRDSWSFYPFWGCFTPCLDIFSDDLWGGKEGLQVMDLVNKIFLRVPY